MQGFKYVVIGGGLAGGRACEAIRRVDKSGSVALITSELHRPYQRPPLSKGYLTGKEGLDQVFLKEESFYAENDIELVTSATAEALDPDSHTVTLAQGRAVQYEKLLLAMGGRPIRLPLPGNELGNVFVLRTIEHCEAIQAAARSSSRALIMGGSFIGCEVATALTQLGVRVTMVFPEARLLGKALSEELSGYLRGMFEQKGVRVVSGARPTALEGEGQVQRARLDNGETLDIDMVAMGVGIRLNTELAREAGLSSTRAALSWWMIVCAPATPTSMLPGTSLPGPMPPTVSGCAWSIGMWRGNRARARAATWPGRTNPTPPCPTFTRISLS
jgi:3-phenylpropionate/trans-cinnamate dioxygenase ferredoxin reductase subunit